MVSLVSLLLQLTVFSAYSHRTAGGMNCQNSSYLYSYQTPLYELDLVRECYANGTSNVQEFNMSSSVKTSEDFNNTDCYPFNSSVTEIVIPVQWNTCLQFTYAFRDDFEPPSLTVSCDTCSNTSQPLVGSLAARLNESILQNLNVGTFTIQDCNASNQYFQCFSLNTTYRLVSTTDNWSTSVQRSFTTDGDFISSTASSSNRLALGLGLGLGLGLTLLLVVIAVVVFLRIRKQKQYHPWENVNDVFADH